MLARIAYSTYFTGIGASGLYGLYTTGKDFEARKKYKQEENPNTIEPEPMISEFIRFSGECGMGFTLGLCFGVMLPVVIVGKTFSMIRELNVITKNN